MMEVFEKASEVLATAVGELFPLFEAAAPVVRLALDNVESKEIIYIKEQFLVVKNKLDVISSELEDINIEIKKARVDSQYFTAEENLRNQFRKYVDVLEAKPQFRDVKIHLFKDHFQKSGGDKNLYVLYDAVIGSNLFGESILNVVERHEAGNRRVLENFCVRMKQLFCLGLIAMLGHCALELGEDDDQEKCSEWSVKMQELETKMKEVIEECINSFAEQACTDVRRLIQEKESENLQDTAQELLIFLERKYDWVKWSVRVFSQSRTSGLRLKAVENYQYIIGQNYFEVLQVNNTNVFVSFCSEPQPVNKQAIQQLMNGPAKRENPKATVEIVETEFSGFVVHAISYHKQSFAAWNFPEQCHYWEKHKKVSLCVHSD